MTILAQNKKAGHDYFLEDCIEAGLVLNGSEVKAIRAHTCSLTDAFVCYEGGKMLLRNAHIPPQKHASGHYDPKRDRPLLLSKSEIRRLVGRIQREGITLVATTIYCNKKWIKAKICVARGKKKHDKRAALKEREWQRDKHRVLARNIKQAHQTKRTEVRAKLAQAF